MEWIGQELSKVKNPMQLLWLHWPPVLPHMDIHTQPLEAVLLVFKKFWAPFERLQPRRKPEMCCTFGLGLGFSTNSTLAVLLNHEAYKLCFSLIFPPLPQTWLSFARFSDFVPLYSQTSHRFSQAGSPTY